MGYILPIQQHEYADYQRRMVSRKRNVTSVERPYKTTLKIRYEELKREEAIRNQRVLPLKHEKPTLSSYANMDEVFSDITGLGQYVNERV